jgi:ribosomal protein S18 acetylase RimI-like enzyme
LVKTIFSLNMTDMTHAQQVLAIQKLAYRVEADLIGFEGIPPLHETLVDLQQSEETFMGYYVDDVLAGALSYALINTTLDIGRLVVHPNYFRRGIGKALVEFVETVSGVEKVIVSTGALNTPARQLYERIGYQLIEEVKLVEGLVIARYEKWLK